jgi:predicted ATPase
VQALFEDGVLQRDGTVKLTRSMNTVKVPATVQGVLAARIDRLPAEEKELLQTLAVIGREFPLSLVRRVVDARKDDELEWILANLQMAEFIYEQPATGDVEYIFKHALTQEVAYNAMLVERRKLLHERAGLALESMFAERLDDHLDELAHHYGRSDNVAKAVEYLGRAGEQALRRSAYADAITKLSAAINVLQKAPDSPERIQRELLLQLAVGPALVAVKGWTVPEVERAYTRARELCERVGDQRKLFYALLGVWAVHLTRGERRAPYELAERLLRRAQSVHDHGLLIQAHQVVGVTSFWMGEFLLAKEHHEAALSLYDPERYRSVAVRYGGIDVGINCLLYGALTLWHLGYPDQALKRGNEAVGLAEGMPHPHGLTYAKLFIALLHQLRREARAVQENAESMISLSAERGLTDYLSWATTLRGWAMAEPGRHEEGIAEIREGLAATGSEGWRRVFLRLLAEVCMATGRLDEGLSAVTEALAAADEHGDRHHEAEMHRLKGELLLKQNVSDTEQAQNCFQLAIEIARKQSAKSWELRATMSLARLLRATNHRDEARSILAEIYNWFTEGFDTADLKDAKALLDELGN